MEALGGLNHDGWRLVFREMDADDLLTCRQVCKTFNQILDEHEFQQRWKFQLILPQLFPYLKSKSNSGDVSWKDLSSIRLTCKSWRHTVDKYVNEVYEPASFEVRNFPLATRIKTSQQIEKIQEMFGETEANPFPSRTVYINNPPGEDRQNYPGQEEYEEAVERLRSAYIEKVGDFLEQFGKNISRLELHFEKFYALGSLSLCKLIRRMTAHLSSLKLLSIMSYNDERGGDDQEMEGEIEMALYWIQNNPLPDMPTLRGLQLTIFDRIIENYLLDKYAQQLTQFNRLTPRFHHLQRDQVERLRNVEEMSLELVGHTDTLEALRFLESPLKLLKLNLWCREITAARLTWNVDETLRNIRHLPLEHLTINLATWARFLWVDVKESGLRLYDGDINTSIRTLNIQISHRVGHEGAAFSFNFLQAFKNLEKLELELSTEAPTHPWLVRTYPWLVRESVKLNQYLERGRPDALYESNVWEKVPSLKIIIIKWGTARLRENLEQEVDYEEATFTREKYEQVKPRGIFGWNLI